MDKKYYSSRHSRLNRNYKKRSNNKPINGTFLLRVNLCLGIAIIVIGCFEIKSDVSNRVADFVKNSLSENINYVDISHNIENVKTFFYGNNSIKTFVFSGNEVVLDDNVVNEINQNKDLYYINNSKATEP